MPAPLYVARPNIRRVVLPDALKTLVLCAVFYVAVQLNIRLFVKYRLLLFKPPATVSYAIAGVLLLLFAIEALNTYRKHALMVYDFYADRIELYGKKPATLQLAMVSDVRLKRNPLDSWFKTGTLVFTPDFRVEHIEQPEQVLAYVQQLVTRTRGMAPAAGQYPGYPQQRTA